MWKRVILYGALLAMCTLVLQWLDYQRLARAHSGDIYVFLIAAAFLALGVWLGARAFGAGRPQPFDGNPQALASLGISAREREVLEEIVAGRSNKEIAAYGEDPRRPIVRETGREAPHRRHPQGPRAGDRALTPAQPAGFGMIRSESPVRAIASGASGAANGAFIDCEGDTACSARSCSGAPSPA
jgi:hypothetical protein